MKTRMAPMVFLNRKAGGAVLHCKAMEFKFFSLLLVVRHGQVW